MEQRETIVNIVDAVMGAGKTQSIVNYINASSKDEKFLVITPFLNEVDRYRTFCAGKKFKTPSYGYKKSKLSDIKKLIFNGENIVSTHALFQKFDRELIDLLKLYDYTLIMDEVANVISEYAISDFDSKIIFENYVDIQQSTNQLVWRKDALDYMGKFEDERNLCDLGSLVSYNHNVIMWMFPIEVFKSFQRVYILTYQFNLQLQKYYYDYFDVQYTYWSVGGNDLKNYHLIPYNKKQNFLDRDYKKLIHICSHEKLNRIGREKYDLSKSWYERNAGGMLMKALKDDIYNYFHNITRVKTKDVLWTTFKEYRDSLKGKGYTKGFLPLNARATNEFKTRNTIVYPVNRYMNPFIKHFFSDNNITIDEDGYALSEMLQFIWRSTIRDGNEIWIYVPSSRMRGLLEDWIEENSK